MPTQTITLYYNGAEHQITDWERQKIRDAFDTGKPVLVEITPLEQEDTPIEIAIGPGIPFHFSATYI